MTPTTAAEFARWIVERLTQANHQALWAGGCVRDKLLGKTPKDYDVATSATPEEVREIFGQRRTIPVGAAFGVMTVIGDQRTGNVEVATFRCDGGYSDGRHPDHVTFSNAEHDAQRRDFTINGLFYDPLQEAVIDYVEGQTDLQARLIRAIGCPHDRFHEDHLRMLRAIRFATVLNFEIEPATFMAIQRLAQEIQTVSGERIAAEMQRLLSSPHRGRGLEQLATSGLLSHLIPQWDLSDSKKLAAFQFACQHLNQMSIHNSELEVSLSLVTLCQLIAGETKPVDLAWDSILSRVATISTELIRSWRLSNESKSVFRAVQRHLATVARGPQLPWSQVQPTLIAPQIRAVLDVATGLSHSGWISAECVEWCLQQLRRPMAELNPPPLLTGDELRAAGFPEGPKLGHSLKELRRQQLDDLIATKSAAWDWVRNQF